MAATYADNNGNSIELVNKSKVNLTCSDRQMYVNRGSFCCSSCEIWHATLYL